jgi:hypothetical protein
MRFRFGSFLRGGPTPDDAREESQEAQEPQAPDEPHEPASEAPAPPAHAAPPGPLSLTLEEATSALRAAGADTIRVGFLARAYARAGDMQRVEARSLLVSVLEERLRARDLLLPGQGFELRDV